MIITSQAKRYAPELVAARYVRRDPVGDGYRFCEVAGDNRMDIRQGRVDGHELPIEIREKADAKRYQAFGYVLWPMGFEN